MSDRQLRYARVVAAIAALSVIPYIVLWTIVLDNTKGLAFVLSAASLNIPFLALWIWTFLLFKKFLNEKQEYKQADKGIYVFLILFSLSNVFQPGVESNESFRVLTIFILATFFTGIALIFLYNRLGKLQADLFGRLRMLRYSMLIAGISFLSLILFPLGALSLIVTAGAISLTFSDALRLPVDIADQTEKIKRRTGWKIYFCILLVLTIPSYILEIPAFRIWEVIDLPVTAISLIGLFAFSWQKKLFTQNTWKALFALVIFWDIFYHFFLPIPEEILKDLPAMPQYALAIFTLLPVVPLFWALFIYAFKQQEPWK